MNRLRPGLLRRAGLGVVVLGLLIGAVVALAALRLRGVAEDLDTAVELVDRASAALEEGRIGDARSALDDAYQLVSRANGSLYGPAELELAAALPVVGANLDVVREGVALATRLVDGGRRVLAAAAPLEGADGTLEVSLSDGTLPLAAVSGSQQEIRALVTTLPAAPPDHPRFVVSGVADASDSLHREALRRREQLGVLDRGLSLLTELAGGNGDRRYLLAIANSAEMRGSGGMILNYGVLEGSGGTLDLSAFGRIDELSFTGPVDVPDLPADYLERWRGFDPLSRWRNANLAGDYTVVAPVLEAMYEAATGQPVNGVIQIDPVGLAHLLDGVGAVQVPELGQVGSDNVVSLTLNEAYVRFPGIDERTDVLGDVAEAAFRRLVDGEIPSLRRLATGLVQAIDGRHLLVHSSSREAQVQLAAFAADGALPPVDEGDSVQLTVQNLAGNKLDYYLDTGLVLRGERPAGDVGNLTAEVTLTNSAPTGVSTPRYIFGPGPTGAPVGAGVIRSLVTLYLPAGASLEGMSGDATVGPGSGGSEAGRPYATFTVDVPAGSSRTVELGLRLAPRPPGRYVLQAVPTPRVRPTALAVDIDAGTGTLEGSVELDGLWAFIEHGPPRKIRPLAFR